MVHAKTLDCGSPPARRFNEFVPPLKEPASGNPGARRKKKHAIGVLFCSVFQQSVKVIPTMKKG
jgi:hypothetical protein